MAHSLKAVKGSFFNTPYWSSKMKLAVVGNNIRSPKDPFWDDIFDDAHQAQRDLNMRRVIDQMVPYLGKEGAFFSALTVILVPASGDHLEEGKHYKWIPSPDDPDIGKLELDDEVLMFPADGQHRREALHQAVNTDKKLASHEVPIIFIPFESVDQVRQVFADLNLHAKTPSKTIGFDFDSRDPIVLIAKRVMQEVALFEDGKRVNVKTNSLAAKSPAVISLNTLVEATRQITAAILDTPVKTLAAQDEIRELEGKDLSDPDLVAVAEKVGEVFEVIINALGHWQDLEDEGMSAGKMRDGVKDADGKTVKEGHISAFGIGWQALSFVAAAIIREEGEDWSAALELAIGKVDWRKGPQWHGIAMVGTRVNNTGPGVRATAGYVLTEAGYSASNDDDIKSLIKAYENSLEAAEPYDQVA